MQIPVVRSFRTDGRPGAEEGHPCCVPEAATGQRVDGRKQSQSPTVWEGEPGGQFIHGHVGMQRTRGCTCGGWSPRGPEESTDGL